MLKEKEFSFSLICCLPLTFLFLSFIIMNGSCSLLLQCSALLLCLSSSVWGNKGLFVSCLLFLGVCPSIFRAFSSLLFFLIVANTGFIIVLLKLKWNEREMQNRTLYLTCLEELKKKEDILFFVKQQLEDVEKEYREGFLEEDTNQKTLIDLFLSSQKKCSSLDAEVRMLEELLLKAAKPVRKRKKKEESIDQGLLF